jgi:hypothetical protein
MGKWQSLPWLIRASADEDKGTSQFAQELVERWFAPPLCNRVFTKPSAEQRRAIDEAAAVASSRLAQAFRSKLQRWLDAAAP